MILSEKQALQIARQARGDKEKIVRILWDMGFMVRDETDEPYRCNVYVVNSNDTQTRIYSDSKGTLRTGIYLPVVIKKSGIPVFEPSGKWSF